MTAQVSPKADKIPPDSLARVRFVMVGTSHPGNVGAAARAIKTMGFAALDLVAPRLAAIEQHPEAIAFASGATDVLAAARTYPDLRAALANTSISFGLSARPREIGPPALDIRQSAALAAQELQSPAASAAVVLGPERTGLDNADLGLCQRLCHIPANPHYSSLNVSQALQLAAWELRYALLAAAGAELLPAPRGSVDFGSQAASAQEVEQMLAHLEQAMRLTGFLRPSRPRKLLQRMRQMLIRNRLSHDEAAMLRGFYSAIERSCQPLPPNQTESAQNHHV